jgi:hypothetical protein
MSPAEKKRDEGEQGSRDEKRNRRGELSQRTGCPLNVEDDGTMSAAVEDN